MIERDGDRIEITCNDCPAGLGKSYASDDFDVMLDDAKSARWRVFRQDGKWRHRCPNCAGTAMFAAYPKPPLFVEEQDRD